jgi:hypothetical protein
MAAHKENIADFSITSSKWNKKWLIIVHAGALSACLVASLSLEIQVILVILTSVSFIFNLRRYTGSKAFLRFQSQKGWAISFNGKDYGHVEILERTVCTPFFIMINFSYQQQQRYLFFWHDAMDQDSFRRLTVFLRLYGK